MLIKFISNSFDFLNFPSKVIVVFGELLNFVSLWRVEKEEEEEQKKSGNGFDADSPFGDVPERDQRNGTSKKKEGMIPSGNFKNDNEEKKEKENERREG